MASGMSMVFLPSDPNEIHKRLKLLLQKNQLEIFLIKLKLLQ